MTIMFYLLGVITGVAVMLCVCYEIEKRNNLFDKAVNGHNSNDIMLIDHLKEKVKKLEELVSQQEQVILVQDLVVKAVQLTIKDKINVEEDHVE